LETIYIYLLDEGTDVWAPVDAVHVLDDVFRVVDCRGEDNAMQFGIGALVRCKPRILSGGEVLVAYEQSN
jgi:hypothetical protein